MRDLLSVPAMRPPGSPRQGDLAGSIEKPRGSAPRERDHRGGDHPVPSRTRQLSPPSPRVLQREAAGGQGVALAEGAFLMRAARGPRGGGSPLRAFPRFGGRLKAPFRVPGARPTAAHARHPPIAVPGARPEGRPCRAVLRSGAARLLGSALYALRVISPAWVGAFRAFGTMKVTTIRYLTQRGNA